MFAVVMNDEFDGKIVPVYWTCRCGDTDNYTLDKADATVFKASCYARAMAEVLGVEHYVVDVSLGGD